jgi:predicted aldo/keto reductase-like oxidoreductase
VVQVGYNVFDIQGTEPEVETYPDYLEASGLGGLLDLARSKDVAVVAMKTLRVGGRRQDLAGYRSGAASIYQAMLKWVLADTRVASALVEILNHREMEEDLGAVGARMTAPEKAALARFVRETGRDYCHMCGLCARACPSGIAVTDILRCLAYHESYGKTVRARQEYAALEEGTKASACRDCGACEAACPYGVSIRARIGQAGALLA